METPDRELVDLQFGKQALTLSLPVDAKSQKKGGHFVTTNKGVPKVFVSLPFLTNAIELKVGQSLRGPRDGPIVKIEDVD